MKLSIREVLQVPHLGEQLLETLKGKQCAGVSIDSRLVQAGDLFFAIRGERLDGHEFVGRAFAQGARMAIVDAASDRSTWTDKPLLIVSDTTKTLGTLAQLYRKKFDIPCIAVAGSNGKTTTKEMITAVLGSRYTVLSTQGNLNNHIGVPQTLFRLEQKHEMAVIEIGTNHFGEIAALCEILDPTHGIITNIGREHLEFLTDLDGVARAEGELFKALTASGVGFVNVDDARVVGQAKRLKKKITYGFQKPAAHVRGKFVNMNSRGCVEFAVKQPKKKLFTVQLSVPGKHAMHNALAAAAVGLAMKVPAKNIQESLASFSSVGKRMEVVTVGGVTILNDTYNANPDSVVSALETLRDMTTTGKKIVVLADMKELGQSSVQEHARIGELVGKMEYEFLLTYGEMARCIHDNAKEKMKIHYDQKNILSEYALELLSAGDIVLIKGSRSMKMEDVVTFLLNRLTPGDVE